MIQIIMMTWTHTIDPMKVARAIKTKSIEALMNQRVEKEVRELRNPSPWSNDGEERTPHITVTGSMHRTPILMSPMTLNWTTFTMT